MLIIMIIMLLHCVQAMNINLPLFCTYPPILLLQYTVLVALYSSRITLLMLIIIRQGLYTKVVPQHYKLLILYFMEIVHTMVHQFSIMIQIVSRLLVVRILQTMLPQVLICWSNHQKFRDALHRRLYFFEQYWR